MTKGLPPALKITIASAKIWITKIYNWCLNFLSNDLWVVDIKDISSRNKRWLLKILRVTRMVANMQGFNKISKNAQALTYMAGLSVIPMLTVLLYLVHGRLYGLVEKLFGSLLPANSDFLSVLQTSGVTLPPALLESIRTMSANLSGISIFSVAILIGSIALTLLGVEDNVNDVYGIKRSRSYPKRVITWSLMIITAPILPIIIMLIPGRQLIHNMFERMQPGLLAAKESLQNSMAAGIHSRNDFDLIMAQIKGPIKNALLTQDTVIFFLLVLLSFTAIFAVLYKALPYTKVQVSASIISGLMASFIWFLWDLVFVVYVLWPGTTSKIYGSLAVIPFFFLWLYVSWVIFLYGAKICYAIQYAPNYDPAVENGQYATSELERVCCRIFLMLGQRWQEEKSHADNFTAITELFTIEELVAELKVPLRIVERAIDALEEAKLIRVTGRDNIKTPVKVYLSCDPNIVTMSKIQQAARSNGAQRTLPLKGGEQEKLDQLLKEGRVAEETHLSKIQFAALIKENDDLSQEST